MPTDLHWTTAVCQIQQKIICTFNSNILLLIAEILKPITHKNEV